MRFRRHCAPSALVNLAGVVPGPIAQAITYRAFGAGRLPIVAGTLLPGELLAHCWRTSRKPRVDSFVVGATKERRVAVILAGPCEGSS
jgi:hypothetical protein